MTVLHCTLIRLIEIQMTKSAISLATRLAILTSVACPLWAQGPERPGRGGTMTMRTPVFLALDADGDGTLSAAEIANAPRMLKTLDKNGDGQLTEEEVRPMRGGREGGRREAGPREGGREDGPGETAPPSADDLVKNLMAFDKNGDGKLTRDELPERMQGLFDRADTDKDGILTVDEIRKIAQLQAAPAQRGRREGERGEGERGPRMSFMKLDPILAALDSDGDGVISSAEIANASASLRKLDKNQDGQLTEDEVRINIGFGRSPGPERN